VLAWCPVAGSTMLHLAYQRGAARVALATTTKRKV